MKRFLFPTAIVLLLLALLYPLQVKQPEVAPGKLLEDWAGEPAEATGLDASGGLTSHLPVVVIGTYGQTIPGFSQKTETKLRCDYAIIDTPEHVNRWDAPATVHGKMELSVRGNSSRKFDKKQYAVKLVDDQGEKESQSLLGMPKGSSWVLNGSYIDRSQIRNYISYGLCRQFMDFSPRCRLCEVVFLNADGTPSYQGIYTLIEKPVVDPNRVNLTPYQSGYDESSFLLLMNTDIESTEIHHLKPDQLSVLSMELLYPGENTLTEDTQAYIQREMYKVEKALHDATVTGDWHTVEQLIDLDSFVDYYIVNEFFQNYDAGTRSTYLYRNLGGKLCIGPVWDFDGVMDNFFLLHLDVEWLNLKTTYYYSYLIQMPQFVDLCMARYAELRQSVLSEEYLLTLIDHSVAYLGSAIQRNADLWYHGKVDSVYRDIEDMKTFIRERGAFFDRVVENNGIFSIEE